jgi:hypothetical protein
MWTGVWTGLSGRLQASGPQGFAGASRGS